VSALRLQVLPLILAGLLLGCTSVPGWSASPDELKEALNLTEQVEQLSRAGRYKQALPLAQKALQIRYKNLGPEHPETALSLTSLGMLYQEIGSSDEALPLLERALKIRYKALGPSHPETAASLNNLAELYRLTGSPDKALPLLERALRLRERILGPEHPDTAASLNNLAAYYQDRGELDKALPLSERALQIREKALSPNHPDTAVSLNNLAELYRLKGTFDKALPLHERAVRINQNTLGPLHPATALSLNNLATLYHDMGFYTKAQPLYEQALQIRQKALGLEHPSTVQSLNNLGVLYQSLKEFDKALPLYERALEIRERTLKAEHPEVAASLNNLAGLYKDLGNPDKALPLAERALQIRDKALGPDHPETITSLTNLAAIYKDLGTPAKALPMYERVVKSKEKTSGPEHPDTASSLTNLALAYQGLGEYDKAQPLSSRALKIREKALGAEHLDTIASLNNLSVLYSDMGAFEKSLPLYERLVKIREKTPGPDHPDTAVSLNNLALVYQGLGEYDKALPLYERSLKIKEAVPEPENSSTARTLVNLASLYQAMGAYDKAKPLYERAVKIREKAAGPDHPETASSLDNQAGLEMVMGRYDKALPLYERIVKISEKYKGAAKLDTANSLQKLAALYQLMGDQEKALPLSERTAKMFEQTLGPQHPDTARALANVGLGYLAKNDAEKAEHYLKQVKSKDVLADVALIRGRPEDAWQLLDGVAPPLASTPAYQIHLNTQKGAALAGVNHLPEAAVTLWQAIQGIDKKPQRRQSYLSGSSQAEENLRPYRKLVEVVSRLARSGNNLPAELQEIGPKARDAAFSLAEAAKARGFLEGLSQSPQPPSRTELSPELRPREETLQFQLAAHEAQWDKAVVGGQEAMKEVISRRKKLNADYEAFLSELRQIQPLYAALYYPQPLPVKDLPLAENEVIIAYALGEESGSVFVVRKDGVHYLHQLSVGRTALEAQVREFLEPLINGKPDGFSLQKGQELYDLLLAKPLATISPSEQVIIVPDGILGLLPFEALVMAVGNDPGTSIFVGDQRILLYYPSAAVLAQQRGRAETPTTRPLLALGNPLYAVEKEGSPGKKKKKADKSITPTEPESSQDNKKKKPDQPPTPAEPVKVKTTSGYQALATNLAWGPTSRGKTGSQGLLYPPLPETESEVKEIARIFEVTPEPPDVLLGLQANETQFRLAPLAEYRYLHFATYADLTDKVQERLEPFLLLGQVENKAPDDGFLTLNKILGLDLRAQMVVLSHCRLGPSQVMEGDGVMNLSRACQYAGARSVLVNLWDSRSAATPDFLLSFYRSLKDGKSRVEALRAARFEIRMQYPNPFFWAGFVLSGEG
jgi:tetratricopeptide (TPR) repeat protein/CHAT domain-containing protein